MVLAMRLSTLAFARPKELRQAERSAFDLEAGEWRVARTIMKMKVEHVIPLSAGRIDRRARIRKRNVRKQCEG